MPEFIALSALLAQGRASAHPVALRGGASVPFADFAGQAAAWRAAFAAHAGRRFALYFEDSLDFACAAFGAWHAGKCVYLPADVLPATLARLRTEVDGFAGDVHGEALVQPQAGATAPRWQALDATRTDLVVFTSGSTGTPVAIPKRLAQLFDEVASLQQGFGERFDGACVQASVSHQHIYGLLFHVLLPLACGQPFAAQRLAFPEDMAAGLARGPCVLIASPAHLKRLPEQLPWAPVRAQLRAVFSSGGPLPDDALPGILAALGQAPIEIYGSSESGGVAWRQRQQADALVWQPLPNVQVRVQDDALQVRSPHWEPDDWQTMADRVRVSGGRFELLGRADRIVKVEEKRVSLNALEQALLATGLVAEVRVLLQEHGRTQLLVAAVPTEAGWALLDGAGKRALSDRLRAALAAQVDATSLPRRWRYLWALPANAQGKTTEAALLAWFDPRRPAARLLERSATDASLRLQVAADSPYFDGHFPGSPILPGVAQLDWVMLFGRELFTLPSVVLRLEALKFQQVIPPGSEVTMTLAFDAAQGRLGFRLASAAGQHASGRFVLGAGTPGAAVSP